MGDALSLVISCEHGGNRVPPNYARLFAGWNEALESHRGWDPGALELARRLAQDFGAPRFASEVTRLLVDLNRSPRSRTLLSAAARGLPRAEREAILREHYTPYRSAVEREVTARVSRGEKVLHLAVHAFTPVLNGEVRTADIGLLYDPARPPERQLCSRWRQMLAKEAPELRVRMNYPYRGTADALPTWLRRRLPPDVYLGVEIEVNQRFALGPRDEWYCLQERLSRSLGAAARVVAAGEG